MRRCDISSDRLDWDVTDSPQQQNREIGEEDDHQQHQGR